MDDSSLKYFYDALSAARSIQSFSNGKSLEDYLEDEMFSSAVERKFEIIGEALVRIRRKNPDYLVIIEDWPAIIGFRNILAHTYDHVEDTVVWGIIQNQIPGFIERIESIPGISDPT